MAETTKSDKATRDVAAQVANSGKGDGLEDLMKTLYKNIKDSDWLKQNTAEKWQEENKDLAAEFLKAQKASKSEPGS